MEDCRALRLRVFETGRFNSTWFPGAAKLCIPVTLPSISRAHFRREFSAPYILLTVPSVPSAFTFCSKIEQRPDDNPYVFRWRQRQPH